MYVLIQGGEVVATQRRSAMKAFLGGKGIFKALEIAWENDNENFFDVHPEYDKAKYMRGYQHFLGTDSKGKLLGCWIPICSFVVIIILGSYTEQHNSGTLEALTLIILFAAIICQAYDFFRKNGWFVKKDDDRLYYEKVNKEKLKWLAAQSRPLFDEDSIQQLKEAGKIWLVVFAAYTGIGLIPAVMMLFGKSVSPLSIVAAVLNLDSLDAISETTEIVSSTVDVDNASGVIESAPMLIKIDDLYVDGSSGDIYDANHGHIGHVERVGDTLSIYDDKVGLVSIRDANGVITDSEGNKLGLVNNDGANSIIYGVDGKKMIITKEGSANYKVSVQDELGRTL